MVITDGRVILRDFVREDIEDRIRWETVETEWLLWDAPWELEEEEPFSPDAYRDKMLRQLSTEKDPSRMRRSFQICINNGTRTHIGWCNSYNIDANYDYTDENGYCTIGIDIPEQSARRQGYATAAWKLFIEYLLSNGVEDIYTQTWSGNERVLGLIRKMGFEECARQVNYRMVRGQSYDGLTFKLNISSFRKLAYGK